VEAVKNAAESKSILAGTVFRERTAVALNVLLAVVVAVEAIVLGNLLYVRWDLTQDRAFTISQRTRSFLGSLDKPVRVTVFYGKQYPPHAWTWQRVHDLLEEFQLHTDQLDVAFVDPFREHARAQQLREQYGISPNDFAEGTVVFEFGDKRRALLDDGIVEYASQSGAPQVDKMRARKTFLGEDAFLGVLVDLVQGRKPRVLVLTGHGEPGLEEPRDPLGLHGAAMALGADGFDVKLLRLGGDTPDVPEGTDLVIVAAPTSPLRNEEVHALKSYAEKGGRLLVMPSLYWRKGETKPMDMNLAPLLKPFDIEIGDRLLVDDEFRTRREIVQLVTAIRYDPEHPATRAFGDGSQKPAIFMTARLVEPVGKKARAVAFSTPTTLEKGDISEIWDQEAYRNMLRFRGSLFNPEKDRRGPFPLVVVSELPGRRPELTARMAVAATHNFAANQGLATLPYNKDLFMNLVNWLTSRESHMGISAKHPRAVSYNVRPGKRRLVFLVVMVVMPLIAVLAGMTVWVSRRK